MQQGAAEQAKSPEAFRTISEVADDLDVPQHVLRFWESRFSQIKPVKRAGARRYYRPEDVDLIRGIRALLYTEGFTIKGAQKILRDKGVRYVAELGRGEASPQAQAGKRATGGRPKKDETFRALRAVDFSEEPLPGEKASSDKVHATKAKHAPEQHPLFSDPPAPPALAEPDQHAPSGQMPHSLQKRAKLEKQLSELQRMKTQLATARNHSV